MTDQISPEEKLLKLIKGPKKQDTVIPSRPTGSGTDAGISAAKPKLNSSILRYRHLFSGRKLIFIGLAAAIIYLVGSFVYSWVGLRKIDLPTIAKETPSQIKNENKSDIKPLEYYMQGVQNRQIFATVTENKPEQASGSKVDANIIKDLTLVGILTGDNPQAVILDQKTQKSYYLSKGQFLGDLEVGEIADGKVILNYKGQKYELFM